MKVDLRIYLLPLRIKGQSPYAKQCLNERWPSAGFGNKTLDGESGESVWAAGLGGYMYRRATHMLTLHLFSRGH